MGLETTKVPALDEEAINIVELSNAGGDDVSSKVRAFVVQGPEAKDALLRAAGTVNDEKSLKSLLAGSGIAMRDAALYIPGQRLVDIGLWTKDENRKLNSQMFFHLTKTSLHQTFGGSSEGWARIVEILRSGEANWDLLLEIVGTHSLHPLRVAETVVDIAVLTENYTAAIELLKHFPRRDIEYALRARLFPANTPQRRQLVTKIAAAGVLEPALVMAQLEPAKELFDKAEKDWQHELDSVQESSLMNAVLSAEDDENFDAPIEQTEEDLNEPAAEETVYSACQFYAALLDLGACSAVDHIFVDRPWLVQASEPLRAALTRNILACLTEDGLNGDHTLKKSATTPNEIQELSKVYVKLLVPQLDEQLFVLLCERARDGYSEDPEFWKEYFRQYLLPSISAQTSPEIAWDFLSKLSREERYALYSEWHFSAAKIDPVLKSLVAKAEKETKGLLKRVSNENAREMLGKLFQVASSNPVAAFSVFIGQAEAYDKLGQLVVQEAGSLSPLEWDVLPLVILLQLTSNRQSIQGNGLFESRWLRSLSIFVGNLVAAHSEFDVAPLIEYLLKCFHSGDYSQLSLLRRILVSDCGATPLENLTKLQLKALSGSKKLREKILGPQTLFPQRTSPEAAVELLLLLSRRYKQLLSSELEPKVKAHVLDETSETMLQLSEVASTADPLLSSLTSKGVPFKYAIAACRAQRPELDMPALWRTWWTMGVYDVSFKSKLYPINALHAEKDEHQQVDAKSTEEIRQLVVEDPESFLLECVLPRSLLSPIDGYFSGLFFSKLNDLKLVSHVFYPEFLDLAVNLATPQEAESFGVFLATLFENASLNSPARRNLVSAWTSDLTSTLCKCLGASNWMSSTNSLVIIKQLISAGYPALRDCGNALLAAVSAVSENSQEGDLQLAATSIQSQLRVCEPQWTETILPPQRPPTPVYKKQENREKLRASSKVEYEERLKPLISEEAVANAIQSPGDAEKLLADIKAMRNANSKFHPPKGFSDAVRKLREVTDPLSIPLSDVPEISRDEALQLTDAHMNGARLAEFSKINADLTASAIGSDEHSRLRDELTDLKLRVRKEVASLVQASEKLKESTESHERENWIRIHKIFSQLPVRGNWILRPEKIRELA